MENILRWHVLGVLKSNVTMSRTCFLFLSQEMAEIQLCTVPHNDTLVDKETMVVPKYYNAPEMSAT